VVCDLVQVLTPEGVRIAEPRFDKYLAMWTFPACSRCTGHGAGPPFDREANSLQRQGQLGIWVPLLGQEAAQIGAGRPHPRDMAFRVTERRRGLVSRHRPTELLGIFRGTDHGSWDPAATGFTCTPS